LYLADERNDIAFGTRYKYEYDTKCNSFPCHHFLVGLFPTCPLWDRRRRPIPVKDK
jgi:hypothetical protein